MEETFLFTLSNVFDTPVKRTKAVVAKTGRPPKPGKWEVNLQGVLLANFTPPEGSMASLAKGLVDITRGRIRWEVVLQHRARLGVPDDKVLVSPFVLRSSVS